MRILLRLLVWLVFIGGAAYGAGWYYYTKDAWAPLEKQVLVRGSLPQVAQTLADNDIIRLPEAYMVITRLNNEYRQFRAGEYIFPKGVTPQQASDIIIRGEQVQHKVTLPEGVAVAEFLPTLNSLKALDGEPLAVKDIAEGSLLADTYFYTLGETRKALVQRMQQALQKEMATLWPNREKDLPLDKKREALTLASVIEKETAVASEYPQVASVFVNRLRLGMPLQADATVVYALTGGEKALGRVLTRQDWLTNSPHNTYVNTGLPPTPITNVGRGALRAALHPADTDYLYFVADGSGGHVFAETLEEHNKNVMKWREIKRRAVEQD